MKEAIKTTLELTSARDVRIYKTDWQIIRSLHFELYETTGISMTKLIREAVHKGLPILVKELEALPECFPKEPEEEQDEATAI